MESLRALKRSIVLVVCVAFPLVLAGASLASKTPAKKAPHRPPVRHSPKHVAGIARKPKFEASTILVKFLKSSSAASKVRALRDTPVRSIAGGVEIVRLQKGETVAKKVAQYDKRARRRLRRAELRRPQRPRCRARRTTRSTRLASRRPSTRSAPRRDGRSSRARIRRRRPTPTIAIVDSGIDFDQRRPFRPGRCVRQRRLPHRHLRGRARRRATTAPRSTAPRSRRSLGALTEQHLGLAGIAYSSPLMSVRRLDSNDSFHLRHRRGRDHLGRRPRREDHQRQLRRRRASARRSATRSTTPSPTARSWSPPPGTARTSASSARPRGSIRRPARARSASRPPTTATGRRSSRTSASRTSSCPRRA